MVFNSRLQRVRPTKCKAGAFVNKGEKTNKSGAAAPEMKKSTKLFFSGVLVLTITNLLVKAVGLLFKIPIFAN